MSTEKVRTSAARKMIRVRWHTYDQAPARVEWLELPAGVHTPYAYAEFISSHLREHEGLPPDDHKYVPGRRVLWFEWDHVRTADIVAERFADDTGVP